MYDPITVHGREVLERVEEAFGDKVFETVISRTVKFPETTAAGSPINELQKHVLVNGVSNHQPHFEKKFC